MPIEDGAGDIPNETAQAWGASRGSLFGPGIINRSQTELEGARDTISAVLGFEVESEQEIPPLPTPKLEGARSFIPIDEFIVGIQNVRPKSPQTWLVYMQHWLVASM